MNKVENLVELLKKDKLTADEDLALRELLENSFLTFDDITFDNEEHELNIKNEIFNNIQLNTVSHQEVEQVVNNTTSKTVPFYKILTLVAAVFVMIFGAYWILNINKASTWDNEAQFKLHETAFGVLNDSLLLPDGSLIVSKPGTLVAYWIDDKHSERLVKLIRGEALFNVKKNGSVFKVLSANTLETIVTGTSFIIEASNDEQISVSLLSGSVSVNNLNDKKDRVLKLVPSEKLIYDAVSDKFAINKFEKDAAINKVVNGVFYLKNATSKNIEQIFSVYYNKSVSFRNIDTELIQLNFPFDASKPYKDNLDIICDISGWKVNVFNDQIVFVGM